MDLIEAPAWFKEPAGTVKRKRGYSASSYLKRRLYDFLERRPHCGSTNEEIVEMLGNVSLAQLKRALADLKRENLIEAKVTRWPFSGKWVNRRVINVRKAGI